MRPCDQAMPILFKSRQTIGERVGQVSLPGSGRVVRVLQRGYVVNVAHIQREMHIFACLICGLGT